MRKQFLKTVKSFACMLGAAILVVAAIPVLQARAASIQPGKNYAVNVVPVYQNPDNGTIDDSGKNPALGQMMVEAQVQSIGYLEVEEDGTIWLHTRWNQPDDITYNTKFEISSDGSQSFQTQDCQVTNQTVAGDYEFMGNVFSATITDYKFRLNTPNDTIRCTYFVNAMQRQCIWYCYISGITGEGIPAGWWNPHVPNISLPEGTTVPETATQPETVPPVTQSETTQPETEAPAFTETAPPETETEQPETTQPEITEEVTAETSAPAETEPPATSLPPVSIPDLVDREVADPTEVENTAPSLAPGEVQGIVGLETDDGNDRDSAKQSGPNYLVIVLAVLAGAALLGAGGYAIYKAVSQKSGHEDDLF